MRRIAQFELRPISGSGHAPRARLVRDGAAVPTEVDGAQLEAQFEVDGRYVLFLTDDCPYEEMLHIVLLDEDLRSLDGLRVGAPYSPGVLRGVHPDGERQLSFEFPDDTRYRLTIHPRPRWSLRAEGPGARRVRRWPGKQYMELRSAAAAGG